MLTSSQIRFLHLDAGRPLARIPRSRPISYQIRARCRIGARAAYLATVRDDRGGQCTRDDYARCRVYGRGVWYPKGHAQAWDPLGNHPARVGFLPELARARG